MDLYKQYKYLKPDGTFDYDEYVRVQTETNKRKIHNVWAREENIAFLSEYIKSKLKPSFGLCHGTRNGREQEWFMKYLNCDVVGTEISDTANNFPNTIQWDFHDVKPEWLNSVDFIYSNSFDHSYEPEKCLKAWMSCLKPDGMCIIEHSSDHDEKATNISDPFGASIYIMPFLILRWGFAVVDLIETPLKWTKRQDIYQYFLVIKNISIPKVEREKIIDRITSYDIKPKYWEDYEYSIIQKNHGIEHKLHTDKQVFGNNNLNNIHTEKTDDTISVYTFLSESHKYLFYKYFIPSFPFEEKLRLVVRYLPQELCPSGEWRQKGWIDIMRMKVANILIIINETPNNAPFIISDVDVQFFGKIRGDLINHLQDYDICFQRDSREGHYCAGFYIARANSRVRALFEAVYEHIDKFPGEQPAMNYFIQEMNIRVKHLDEKYYTAGVYHEAWNGEEDIYVLKNILMHHANWTVGVENKARLMDLVREKVKSAERLSADRLIDDAETLIQSGNINDAGEILARVLEDDPSNVQALNNNAVINILEHNYKIAFDNLSSVLKMDPSNETAQENLKILKECLDSIPGNSDTFKVSAIVSVYNSEKYIKGCLEDLINQTLYKKGKLEIIIVNSGSTQNEDSIIKEFQSRYKHINYIKTEERETIYQAWNRAIKASNGTYITNANTDDRHHPEALERLSTILDDKSDIDVVYADSYITTKPNETFSENDRKNVYRWRDYDKDLLLFGCYMGPQPMWRKSLHDAYGYFEENLNVVGDYEFWLRLSEGAQFYHHKEILGLYLYSEASAEHRDSGVTVTEDEEIRKNYIIKYVNNQSDIDRIAQKLEQFSHNAQEYYSRAMKLLNQREKGLRLQESIERLLEQALHSVENGIQVKLDEAIDKINDKSILIDKEEYLPKLYAFKGACCQIRGEYEEALQQYKRVLEIKPGDLIAKNGIRTVKDAISSLVEND